jgi:hypothetical protein
MFPAKGIGLACVGLVTALVAWPALFSTLAPYDDEGYCMMTLRTFAQGDRLYGATHTQYGPAYYFFTSPIHEYLGWPLTQTGVRVKTLFTWCFATVLVYLFVRRLQDQSAIHASGTMRLNAPPSTSVRVLSAICIVMVVILHLDRLALEPGHPQEMVLIGSILSLLLLSTNLSSDNSTRHFRWFVAGVVAAVIGFTKLNCGMILALAMMAAAVVDSKSIPSSRWIAISLVAFPIFLVTWMARSSFETAAWTVWIAACAIVAILRVANGSMPSEAGENSREAAARSLTTKISSEPWLWVVAGGLITSIALIVGSFSTGITVNELWFGIVGQHTDFGTDFFKPIPWDLGCLLGLLSVGLLYGAHSSGRFQRRSMVVVAGLVLACLAWTACDPLLHGLKPRGAGSFLAWFLPGWLGLVYRCQRSDRFIVILGILSPLIAYPVSGTQVAIGTTPGLILFGFAVGQMIGTARFGKYDATKCGVDTRLGLRIMTGVACLFVASTLSHWCRYVSFEPLDLPGSTGMRLSPAVVEQQRAIVEAVKSCDADTLVFEGHNNNRFHFWTGTKPATSANPTFWPRMLNESERQRMQEILSRPGRYCVVRVPEYELFYDERTKSIQEQLRKDWEPTSSIGEWDVGVVEVQEANAPSQNR